jgi:RadC-like JAB domain
LNFSCLSFLGYLQKARLIAVGRQPNQVQILRRKVHKKVGSLTYVKEIDFFQPEIYLTYNICVLSAGPHIGSLNSSIVHPREVMKSAILNNAASIIVSHQHPSGDPTPSREDIEVTKRLAEAGRILGIEVLDHVIVTHTGNHVSLKEKGYL